MGVVRSCLPSLYFGLTCRKKITVNIKIDLSFKQTGRFLTYATLITSRVNWSNNMVSGGNDYAYYIDRLNKT